MILEIFFIMTRDKLIREAIDRCLKEIYQYATPKVNWEDFIEQNKVYSKKYKAWERFRHLYYKEDKTKEELEEYSTYPVSNWENKSITECIGPAPYEFYYIPKSILDSICGSYINAYRLDSQQNLLDIIEILKNYCEEPIVDKYIEDYTDEYGNHHPGYRGYHHPDPLKEDIATLLRGYVEDQFFDATTVSKEIVENFYEFLDMAGGFYNWNHDLNTFNMSVYLGPSPNSNKEAVIKNWKEYRGEDIEIDDKEIEKEFYGEED